MADTPEIPEAKDPFEMRVALTIAIIAICLSFIENRGDNAKTDAIIKTNEASNQWGYYQAKSIKGQMAEMHGHLLSQLSPRVPVEQLKPRIDVLAADTERYEKEKGQIKATAEGLQKGVAEASAIDDRCDEAALFLQIAIVICSVAILAQTHWFWWGGMALAVVGIVLGATAFLPT
jgi:hypothetical protein